MTTKRSYKYFLSFVICILCGVTGYNQKPTKPVAPIYFEKGRLGYAGDAQGNRVPDFSYCGYKASEQIIPAIEVKVVVPVIKGDATLRIQSAIDYIAKLPMDANGFRGAVLLNAGNYDIAGQLKITASGIVLRGSGSNSTGTTLTGQGTTRDALIRIYSTEKNQVEPVTRVMDPYVPVGAMSFHVDTTRGKLFAGQFINMIRPATKKWIDTLGTGIFGGGISALGWKPDNLAFQMTRRVTKVEGALINIDAPVPTAIDSSYGGTTIDRLELMNIKNVGVENLRCISAYDKKNPKDEDHRWNAINMESAYDGWVRQVSFENFAGSAVYINEWTNRITVEDCQSIHPVSEIGGQRRYTFFTSGQQTLFQRCYAESGYHDFATGYHAIGPNAFVQCESIRPYNFSGAIDSWSSAILFDVVNIDGNALRFGNRGQDGNGAGWCAANSVTWNCTAALIECSKPPTAQNWSFASWSQFQGDGYWGESNNTISPRSLYYQQLKERLNKEVDAQSQLLFIPTEASSSPTVDVAMELTKLSAQPRMQLKEWIASASKRNAISLATNGAKTIDQLGVSKIAAVSLAPLTQIKSGWIVRGDKILTGKRLSVPWWSGGVNGINEIAKASPAITRYVPGRVGKGLTDDLDEMTDGLLRSGTIGMEQNYGLWYDRRRDDHERIRRMDGDVWPPFYELPFARSGKDSAWDGLSKYDLTKYNAFYWGRLKQYADLADQKGLLLINQNYFQHNIIEAGAHYADFPWRTANNINNTGFPEPPPYAGDKRIFMAEQFYDITNPVRKELHRKFIRQCLDNFKDNNGVIQLIGEEFTGPFHFVKFWLETVRDWEKETGRHPLIGLAVTKDVQDSILAIPAYASVVDIIDIRYWHYQADSIAYAPKGGQNLAPRQHARLLKPKKTSFEQVYRAVKEYRDKYPGKAVIYSGDSYPEFGMAVFMAGGSLAVLPGDIDPALLKLAAGMKPVASTNRNEYILTDGKNSIVYSVSTRKLERR